MPPAGAPFNLHPEGSMSHRALPWLVVPLAMGVAAAAGPESLPTTRYKIESVVTSAVDLSAVGQGEQKNEFTLTGFVTVTLTDSAGGKVMHAVLDSASVLPAPPGAAPGSIEGQQGAMYHAFITADGKTEGFKVMGDSAAPKGGQLTQQVLRDFYPRLKKGFKSGDAWADTSETKEESPGNSSTVNRITSYSVGPEGAWAGGKGHEIKTTSTYTMSMSQEGEGGATQVEGAGTGSSTWYVTSGGSFLGGTSTSSADLTAMTAFGDFPVKQSSRTTVTALP